MRIPLPESVGPVLRALREAGYRPYLAGGAVRDWLLGREPKDFDFEVYGCNYAQLETVLARHGRADLVGKSFGVVKLAGIDFSLPRRESKTGAHHRDFVTEFEPTIQPREACSRRDFTINAMLYEPFEGKLLDFFGGERDLRAKVLRATSHAFAEDPLRVLRGMQFACRFDLEVEPETAARCESISSQYETIARERVAEEWMKWALKASRPGRAGEYLARTGWLRHFPEISAMQEVPQDPEWHPEGDVFVHTMLVLDAAAKVAERERIEGDGRAVLLFAALGHDLAKATTTLLRDKGGVMRWTAWGHEEQGAPLSRSLLTRMGIKHSIIAEVEPLVANHLITSHIREVTPRAIRRLAMRLAPSNIQKLIWLIEADHSGRPPLPGGLPEGARRIFEMAQAQAVVDQAQQSWILGRHVLPYFDGRPGRHIGEVVKAATEAQADGEFSTEPEALAWLERYISHSRN